MGNKKYLIVFLVFVFQAKLIFSFDFEYTSQSSDMAAFFQDEMTEYMRILGNGQNVPFYISAYANTVFEDNYTERDRQMGDTEGEPVFAYNLMTGSFIRLNRNLLLPINAMISMPMNVKITDLHLLFNSGLVFQGNFGLVGLFAGYDHNRYKELGEYIPSGYNDAGVWTSGGRNDTIKFTQNKMFYSFVPMINTSQFPILGYVLNKAQGYINTDQSNETNYGVKLVSQPLTLGSVTINSINPYYSRRRFNLSAEIITYGLLSNINVHDRFAFFIDIGFKDYFNAATLSSYYNDTPYLRFGFPLKYDWQNMDVWQGLSFYFDKQFLLPKIGYIYQVGNSRFIMEAGIYNFRNWEILLAYRTNIADQQSKI